ncbi:T9SS type A sorting domain-containing protein [Ferruginibacter sp.]
MKTIDFSLRRGMLSIFALLVFSFAFSTAAFATTYYVSTTGNDATGTGTAANPWKTLYKACSAVTGVGNIIHVNAGTYNETQKSNLATGVSLEGDGVTSIITSTAINTEFSELLSLYSAAEGTDGNQQISNLKFDGQMITYQGIKVIGRKNVAIHDCYITNYINRGIIFSGRTDNTNNPPAVYATGNSFYNNTVINCSEYDHTRDYGAGCLNIGGQMGIQIYNNTITQNSRAEGYNGWPIKGYLNGFIRGGRIYNNTLTKKPLANGNGAYNWDFCIELFDEQGLEIDHNTIRDGGIDCNHQRKGNYAYSVWIHDNDLQLNTISSYGESAVTLEFHTENAIVENNKMTNYRNGIIFTPRPNDTVKNVSIQRNLMSNVNGGYYITMSNGDAGLVFDSIKIYNNTMIGNPSNKPMYAVDFPYTSSGGPFTHFDFINNNCGNATNFLRHGGSVPLNYFTVKNNNFYTYTSITSYVGAAPTNYTYTGNLMVTPTYGTNYTLVVGSPLIDAGINVGLPYAGSAPDKGYAEANLILPVKLIDFDVTANKGDNLLQWKTVTESNSSYFSIERSNDGQHFTEIGRVNSAGFSSSVLNYQYNDAAPPAGINYYRLVMLDKDNTAGYSNIVAITNKLDKTLAMINTKLSSANRSMLVSINSDESVKALLSVFDQSGRVYISEPVQLQKGITVVSKNTPAISKGIYYIKLDTGGEKLVKNVIAD